MNRVFLVLILIFSASSAYAEIYTLSADTPTFCLGYWVRGARGWDDLANKNLKSIDSVLTIISNDIAAGGGAVTSVAEGVTGPLVIVPTTGNATVSIQSADSTTAGYISAVNFNTWTNDRVSQDTLNIVSNDVSTLYNRTTIISSDASKIFPYVSADVFTLYNRTNILSNDAVTQNEKLSIISADASKIFPYVSADVATLKNKVTIISEDAAKVFPYISSDISTLNNKTTILSNDAVTWKYDRVSRDAILNTLTVATPIADASVANDITLTNITQITNRSHTSLSDIGTNTHAQIDSALQNRVSQDAGYLVGLSSDTVSADVVSTDRLWLAGVGWPTNAPNVTGSVVSWDGTKLLWGTVAGGGGGAVLSVSEGVTGPLAIVPTTGGVTVSIQSADATTAGYISAANYNTWTSDRVSWDTIKNYVSQDTLNIVSNDVSTLYNRTNIISADAGDLKNKTTILSNDAVTWKFDRVSGDTGKVNTLSCDTLRLNTWQFPTDAPADNDVVKWDAVLGRYNNEADATGGGSGESLAKSIAQTGHGFSVGNIVMYDGGAYIKAKANNVLSADAVGIVSAVADVDNFTLTLGGYISTLAALTPGTVYFLSDDIAGVLTINEPDTTGDVSKPMLISVSATEGYVFNFRGVEIGAAAAITSVSEGVAGPLVIVPTTGAVTVSMQSADTTTSGFVSAINYNTWTSDRVSGDVVKSVTEGVAGPLAVTATGQNSTVSIQSADATTAGYISAANYNTWTNDRVSADTLKNFVSHDTLTTIVSVDVATLYMRTAILSNDAVTQDNKITIISADVGDLKSKTAIISNDIADVKVEQKSMTLVEPDQIATVTRDLVMFPIDSYNYPSGITVLKVGASASASTTASYSINSWDTSDWTTAQRVTVDSIFIDTAAESYDTAIAKSIVYPGSYVMVNTDKVDLNTANVTIWFRKK